MKKRLLLLPIALMLVALVGVPTVSASHVTPERGAGNPSCDGFKIDPVTSGTYHFGGAWFTIDVYQTANGPEFDWSSNYDVTSLTVKGGPVYNLYIYDPGVTSDTGLHSPINYKNPHHFWYGLSHLCFEASKKGEPPK